MSERVLIVYHELVEGGLSVDVRNMAGALVESGTDVHVATIDRPDVPAMPSGVHLHRVTPALSSRRVRRFGPAAGVTRLARTIDASVVHVYSWLPVALHMSAMRAARLDGRRLVWTPMMHPARRQLWGAYPPHVRVAMRTFDRWAAPVARRVDAVFAATSDEAEAFRAIGARRVELVPPAVEEVAAVTRRVDRSRILLVAGRDEPRKGLAFAFEAFATLRRELPSARLAIVGDVHRSPMDGVDLLGRLSDAELEHAFTTASVVFVPSSYEAFSRVVIEAWAHGRPAIVTDGVGLASEVRELHGGDVVSFGDVRAAGGALAEVIRDARSADAMGERGRAAVRDRYLLLDVAHRASTIYDELVSTAHGPTYQERVA